MPKRSADIYTLGRQTSALGPHARSFSNSAGSHLTQYRLVHGLAYALGLDYSQYGRAKAEVLVVCVTYVVCASVGLEGGGESIPCIAGCDEDGALDPVREYAQTIDHVARRIEDALSDGADATAAQAEQAA